MSRRPPVASGVRLAPSFLHGLWRSAWIVLATGIVALAVRAIEGPPSRAHVDRERERPPYGPTFPLGIAQVIGQGALLGAGTYVARRWLRIKL